MAHRRLGCRPPLAVLLALLVLTTATPVVLRPDRGGWQQQQQCDAQGSFGEPASTGPSTPTGPGTVVWVLDYSTCKHTHFEYVPLEPFTERTLLSWILDLKDPLTATAEDPSGQPLQVITNGTWGCVPEVFSGETTYREWVEAAYANNSNSVWLPAGLVKAYHLVMASTGPDGISKLSVLVTTATNFWREAISLADRSPGSQPPPFWMHQLGEHDSPVVFVLPRLATMLHGTYATYFPDSIFAKAKLWDIAHVTGMVGALLQRVGAQSMPTLAEWSICPNKRLLVDAWAAYHAEDPTNRVSPIPTVWFDAPLQPEDHKQLCCLPEDQPIDPALLDAAVATLVAAALQLEATIAADSLLRHAMHPGCYVVKRAFGENSAGLVAFQLHVPEKGARPQLMPERLPTLTSKARIVLTQSCGSGWLLQPEIVQMPNYEYRVFLLGGASSKGTPEDVIVVHAPMSWGSELFEMQPLPLPSDTLRANGFQLLEAQDGSDCPRLRLRHDVNLLAGGVVIDWVHCPSVYRAIVSAALDGARAIVAAPQGAVMKVVGNVYARLDVVTAPYTDADGFTRFLLYINDFDFLNSAGMMPAWWGGGRACLDDKVTCINLGGNKDEPVPPYWSADYAQNLTWGAKVAQKALQHLSWADDGSAPLG